MIQHEPRRVDQRTEPDAPARAGLATAAEASDAAGDQTTGNQERQESRSDQADGSAQPGSSPDATADEPHWEDAWRLPDGRQARVRMDGDRDWMHTASAENLPTGEEILSMEDDDAPLSAAWPRRPRRPPGRHCAERLYGSAHGILATKVDVSDSDDQLRWIEMERMELLERHLRGAAGVVDVLAAGREIFEFVGALCAAWRLPVST